MIGLRSITLFSLPDHAVVCEQTRMNRVGTIVSTGRFGLVRYNQFPVCSLHASARSLFDALAIQRYNAILILTSHSHDCQRNTMAKKKANPAKKSTAKGPDFETSLAEVERIVARLESGELGLTESLQQYETGIKQLKRCHRLLDAAEQRVSLLSGFDADGNPITEPMDPLAQRTGSGRSAKRSKRTSEASTGEDPDPESIDDRAGLF